MSILTSTDVLRPAMKGLKGRILTRALGTTPALFGLLRRFRPILRLGPLVIVTRQADVREVFRRDDVFGTPHKAAFDVLTDGEPFLLGLPDTPDYRASLAAMHDVFRTDDLAMLGDRAEAMAETIVSGAGGQIEVVDDLIRKVTFDLFTDYMGLPQNDSGTMDVWATRLFEFLFANLPEDKALRQEAEVIAPALRDHIDRAIEQARMTPREDTILGRCLARQASGDSLFSDIFIRTHLLGMMAGGPPQFPMVIPQILDQMLARPEVLQQAQAAARADDDAMLWTITREALRFDPLAPALLRRALSDTVLPEGSTRATRIPEGCMILVAFASAMKDSEALSDPDVFDSTRPDADYLHFGHGLHACFGRRMNEVLIPRMLKPLLKRHGLRRAPGSEGKLRKYGLFADSLSVNFDRTGDTLQT